MQWLRDAPFSARLLERWFRYCCPGTESRQSVRFADALGLLIHFRRNPLRKWDDVSRVPPGRQVLFSNLRELIRSKSPSYPDQRRPEATMNESNLSVDQATDENFL
jgi:hypothetical protein